MRKEPVNSTPFEETKPAACKEKMEDGEDECEVLDIVRKSQNGSYLMEQADLAMQCKLRDDKVEKKMMLMEVSGFNNNNNNKSHDEQKMQPGIINHHAKVVSSMDQPKGDTKSSLLGQQKNNPIVPYLDDTSAQSQSKSNNNGCIPADDEGMDLLRKVVSRRCSGEEERGEEGTVSGQSCEDALCNEEQQQQEEQQDHTTTTSGGLDQPSTTTLDRSNRLQLPGAFMGAPGDLLRRAPVIPFSLVGSTTSAPDPAAVLRTSINSDNNDLESALSGVSGTANTSQAFSHDQSLLTLGGPGTGDPELEPPVANPVADDQHDLPHAERIHHYHSVGGGGSSKTGRACWDNKGCVIVLVALPFLAAIIILLGIFVLPSNSDLHEEDHHNRYPSPIPETTPTTTPSQLQTTLRSPEEDYVWQFLPQYTKDLIQNSRGRKEPQELAFEWLVQDPNLMEYEPKTIVQRFSLATFYYSTDGDNWERNTNWLSYNHHECEWYAKNFTLYAETNPYIKSFPLVAHLANVSSICGEDWNNRKIDDEEGLPPHKLGHYQYTRLWLWKNGLKGKIPEELYFLTGLKCLQIKFNDLMGSTISTHIGRLTDLEILSLGGSNIVGSVPTEIGWLTNMHTIHTAKTFIEGNLPSELGLLTKMEGLAMDESQHTGTIPTELGGIKSLLVMRLQQNQLTGAVPSEVGLLTNLQDLSVQGNQMSGTLPMELDSIAPQNSGSLMALHLGGSNSFSGIISDQLCDLGVNITCTIQPAFPCGLTFDCSDTLCGCGCQCAD